MTPYNWMTLAVSLMAVAVAILAAVLSRASALKTIEENHNQNIQEMIGEIRAETAKAVEEMRNAVAEIREGIRERFLELMQQMMIHQSRWDNFTECRKDHYLKYENILDRMLEVDKKLASINTELKLRNGKGPT